MEISEITERALKEFGSADTESALEEAYNKYLSKKGEISQLMSQMGKLPKEEKASFGKAVNDARNAATTAYQAKRAEIEKKKLAERLAKEAIDITLPAKNKNIGHINPYYAVIDEVTDIFLDMGYQVVEGRDVETDRFNFELLNVPKDHPARDMQDTYYLEGSDLLLRTQTSAAQAHTMLEKEVKTPIRMISPGKAYRRDDDDMTHSHLHG